MNRSLILNQIVFHFVLTIQITFNSRFMNDFQIIYLILEIHSFLFTIPQDL